MSRSLEEMVRDNAASILDEEGRWTNGAWARSASGERCDPLSPDAVRWCAVGALEVCAFPLVGDKAKAKQLARRIAKTIAPGPGGLVYLNERGPYAAVRDLMASKPASLSVPSDAIYGRQGFAAFARSR